jgi:hypothetical protein
MILEVKRFDRHIATGKLTTAGEKTTNEVEIYLDKRILQG